MEKLEKLELLEKLEKLETRKGWDSGNSDDEKRNATASNDNDIETHTATCSLANMLFKLQIIQP